MTALETTRRKSHAYLVLAHNEPAHLHALISSLREDWNYFFVHIDKKSDIENFKNLEEMPNVFFVKNRVEVYWGGWSQVQASINAINLAESLGIDFSYFTLMSGSHFPLRSNRYIYDYIEKGGGDFINIVKVPNAELGKGAERFQKFYVEGSDRTNLVKKISRRALACMMNVALPRQSDKELRGLKLYAGSQWWTLSKRSIETIKSTLNEMPYIERFFRHVKIPDESFFQTIIGNLEFHHPVQRSFVFTDWSNPKEAPCFIRSDHLQFLLSDDFLIDDSYGCGPALFARKFGQRNADVVEQIRRYRRTNE